MKFQSPFREPVRVLFHAEGGVTYVSLTRYIGNGLADGGVTWDIPTERIPFHLRGIGSEFLVVKPRFTAENNDTTDEIRHVFASVEVQELRPGDTFTRP
jgi:hypothetical protein